MVEPELTNEEKVNAALQNFFIEQIMQRGVDGNVLSIPGNEWLGDKINPVIMQNAFLYANGRFNGLVPGMTPEEGFGGHPGLLYKLITCALCYGVSNIGISISGKVDDKTNPLTYEDKVLKIQTIIAQLQANAIPNIMVFLSQNPSLTELLPTISSVLESRMADLRIEIRQLINPFSIVLLFKELFEDIRRTPGTIRTLIMASGLEMSKTGEYNKYERTFDRIVASEDFKGVIDMSKPFDRILFILTSRATGNTISGTEIRDLIVTGNYEQLARYLLCAGFTKDDLILLYGDLIYKVKTGLGYTASQTEEEYAYTLQAWMYDIEHNQCTGDATRPATSAKKSTPNTGFGGATKNRKITKKGTKKQQKRQQKKNTKRQQKKQQKKQTKKQSNKRLKKMRLQAF